jgi:tRNA (adenine22-N1)-methyltransferase
VSLSPRLSHLRSHYHSHESVWDIGCDHGKLGLSFLDEKLVQKIHLVDPSPSVIFKLRQLIDSYITKELSKISIHEKRGQDIVPDSVKKIIFIAGMGGDEINEICRHLFSYLSPEDDLVISPHQDLLQLREELGQSGFSVGKESLVLDEGRFYQVLSLNRREGKKVHLYGEEIFRGEVGKEYLKHQLKVFSAHQDVRSERYLTYLRTLTQ